MNSVQLVLTLIAISRINSMESSKQLFYSDGKLICDNEETHSSVDDPSRQQSLDHPIRYTELYVVADFEFYTTFFNSRESSVLQYIIQLITTVNSMLEALNLHVILSHTEIWTDKQRIGRQANLSQYLGAANRYLAKQYNKTHRYDALVFITGNFYPAPPNKTLPIGRASVASICKKRKNTLMVMFPQNPNKPRYRLSQFAMLVLHELGHVLGMRHYAGNCACPATSCVMKPTLSDTLAWSDCSRASFESVASKLVKNCYDRPNIAAGHAICGNGIVEGKEQCDCHHQDAICKKCCSATLCARRAQCFTTMPLPTWQHTTRNITTQSVAYVNDFEEYFVDAIFSKYDHVDTFSISGSRKLVQLTPSITRHVDSYVRHLGSHRCCRI
ncbi:Zinc metalloproteinase-disintegrin-like BjussuMP-1 [Halotydeus destructor]|nr:Zinc metalloproteinase-disintegrin-like BjussuMP-1 [Halotydeus destructor]